MATTTKKHAFLRSLTGAWAITAAGCAQLQEAVAGFDWTAPWDDTRFDQRETKIENGVAIIPVIGVLTKYADCFDRLFGCVSAEWLEREVDRLEADPSVKRYILLIDTPWGSVAGTTQFASRIARCSKPIDAVVSDSCCSAGLWIASQCNSITANATAEIGSIGVIAMFLDDSQFFANAGLEWHVVATSAIKAAGQDGKWNDTLKAQWQKSIDQTFAQFKQAVADGREMSIDDVSRLADGSVYRAAEAASLGLIDRVADAAVAIDAIIQEVITMTQQEFQQAAASNPAWVQPLVQQGYDKAKADLTPKNATAKELKAAFSEKEDADFLIARMDVEAPMAEHQVAYVTHLKARLTTQGAEISTVKQQLADADPSSAGLKQPLATTTKPQAEHASPMASAVARANKRK